MTARDRLADISYKSWSECFDDPHEAAAYAVAVEVLKDPNYWARELGLPQPAYSIRTIEDTGPYVNITYDEEGNIP